MSFAFSVIVFLILIKFILNQSTTEYNLFAPPPETTTLRVKNITKNTAEVYWNLSTETKDKLKALRVNCTILKYLVEPIQLDKSVVILYNPSVYRSRITLQNLEPATKYSCHLIGALSLTIGAEKLVILSSSVTFTTVLNTPKKRLQALYGIDSAKIVVGLVVPVVLIFVAVILMLIGYQVYVHNRGKRKDTDYMSRTSYDDESEDFPRKEREKKRSRWKFPHPSSSRPAKPAKHARQGTPRPHPRSERTPPKKPRRAQKRSREDCYSYDVLPTSSEDELFVNTRPQEFENKLGINYMSHCLNPTKCSGENSGLSNPIPIQPAHIEATKLSSPALVYNKQRKQSSLDFKGKPLSNHPLQPPPSLSVN